MVFTLRVFLLRYVRNYSLIMDFSNPYCPAFVVETMEYHMVRIPVFPRNEEEKLTLARFVGELEVY